MSHNIARNELVQGHEHEDVSDNDNEVEMCFDVRSAGVQGECTICEKTVYIESRQGKQRTRVIVAVILSSHHP